MQANGFSFEVIFVNDGSTDVHGEVIEKAKNPQSEHVRGIKFRRNYGKITPHFTVDSQKRRETWL